MPQQTRVAFCVRDHSATKALAGGLDLPDSVAGCVRGTDLTRANISRTRAANTLMGLGTKTSRPGIALSNRGTTLKGKDEAAVR